jgi:Gpi18-like mannosyltransferase
MRFLCPIAYNNHMVTRWFNLLWIKIKPFLLEWMILLFMFGMAISIRLSLTDWVSGDYLNFLRPWLQQIVDQGGWASLGSQIGDYTPPYLYLLTLLSYFPQTTASEPYLLGIKLYSIGFDVVLMIGVYLNAKLWLAKIHPLFPASIAIIALFLPTVIINGSLWGQIDASYTGFSLIAIYYLQKQKPFAAAIWYGVAFSFKLQAIFFLPVFIIYFWFHYRHKIYYVFIIPIIYYVLALPAILAGRSVVEITQIYVLQTQTYKLLTLNMPNLYQWFPNQRYEELSQLAIGLFIVLMAIQFLMMLLTKVNLTMKPLLLLAYWSLLMANFFLPAMHERYLFAADVLILIIVFQFKTKFYLVLATQAISFLAYAPYIFSMEPIRHEDVAIGFAITLIITTYWLWQSLLQPAQEEGNTSWKKMN